MEYTKADIIRYLQDIVILEAEKLTAQKTVFRLSDELELRKKIIKNHFYHAEENTFHAWDKVVITVILMPIWFWIARGILSLLGISIDAFIENFGDIGFLTSLVLIEIPCILYLCSLYKKHKKDIKLANQVHTSLQHASQEKLPVLQNTIDKMQNYYNTTNAVVNSVYAKGIIYPKYQNMIACGMMLEYFLSGRCATLGQAYSLYEEDVFRQNVITSLEELKEGQKLLLAELRKINNKVDYLMVQNERIEENTREIQWNTRVNLYCNAQVAKDIRQIKERWGCM